MPVPAAPTTTSTPAPRAGESPDEEALLFAERWPGAQRGAEVDGGHDTDPVVATGNGAADDVGFDREHLGGGPAGLVGAARDDGAVAAADHIRAAQPARLGERYDMRRGEELLSQGGDRGDVGSCRQVLGDRLEDLPATERRVLRGETVRAGEPSEQGISAVGSDSRRWDRRGAVEHIGQGLGVESFRAGPFVPLGDHRLGHRFGVLGLARRVRGDLRRTRRRLADLLEVRLDLLPAA